MKRERLRLLNIRLVCTVDHATKKETVEITVAPYLAGTVSHAMMDETVKITDYINLHWHMDSCGLLTTHLGCE